MSRRRGGWLLVLVVVLVSAAVVVPALVRRASGDGTPHGSGESGLPQSAIPLPDDVLVWRRERRGEWGIATVSVAGVEGKSLVGPGENNYSAVISPDRRTVLYLHGEDSGRRTLRAVAVDGSQDRRLFSDGSQDCPELRRPALGPDGVLAAVCRSDGQPDVLTLLTLKGQMLHRLDRGKLGDPTFARDGRSIVYWRNSSRGKDDSGDLFEVALDGRSASVQLTDGGGEDSDPAVAPDGMTVAFRRGKEGNRRIESFPLAAGAGAAADPRPLTSGQSNSQDPSWSPDGSQIAFRGGADLNSDLYVMPAAGEPARSILPNPEPDGFPVWTAR